MPSMAWNLNDFLEGLGDKIAHQTAFKTQSLKQKKNQRNKQPQQVRYFNKVNLPLPTLESAFPNIAQLLGEVPATLKEITDAIVQHPRNIDGIQQKVAENLFASGTLLKV